MTLLMQCVVCALTGLGAEVVFTGLRSPRGWGCARPEYGLLYATAPLVLAVLPAPRVGWATCALLAVDWAVRVYEGESRAERVRALRFAPAWAVLAVVLAWIGRS